MKLLALLLIVSSCSFFKKSNEKADGHQELYSMPDKDDVVSLGSNEKRLVIITTNDLRGQLEAKQEKAEDKHSPEKTLVSVGGVEVLARYLEILRAKYPSEVMLMDAGNSLSGTLVSRSSGAKAIVDAFSRLRYDAIGLSANDLAAGPEIKKSISPGSWMPELFRKPSTPVVMSNLLNLKTAQPVEWGSVVPQLLKEVNGVKVGMVGLLPDDLPGKLDAGVLNGLYVEPAMQSFLKQTRSLRLKGAEVIVLMMHGGLKCGIERAREKNLPLGKVNFDPRDPSICDTDGALSRFLTQLPPGSVDVVVTGGGPGKIANFVNGIPVVQAFGHGSSFARIDLVWDSAKKTLNSDKVRLHQPVRLCHRFFKATDDCFTEDETVDHRQLVPARFLDQDIFPEPATARWMNGWRDFVAMNNEPIFENEHTWKIEKEAARAVLTATEADVALVGGDSWRLTLQAGTTTWRELYRQSGARERIRLVTLKGSELATLRDHFTEKVWWAANTDWTELTTRETVTLAINASLWQKQIMAWAQEKQLHWSHTLAPVVVADTIVTWDSVSTQASGRSPALPHTQP